MFGRSIQERELDTDLLPTLRRLLRQDLRGSLCTVPPRRGRLHSIGLGECGFLQCEHRGVFVVFHTCRLASGFPLGNGFPPEDSVRRGQEKIIGLEEPVS